MTNNSINNMYYYQIISTNSWKTNINNHSAPGTTRPYYLPLNAEKGDIILVPFRAGASTSLDVKQNTDQKVIVPFNQTSYAIKTITTPGPAGQLFLTPKGITELIFVCIEKDTTFLMLNFDGFGFNGTIA
jgi:hypothetical protein